MGDVTHIYDTNGALKAHYIYDAWGNHRIYDVNGDEVTKSMSDHIGNINPIRYRGYYYDIEIELYYLEARYYDPETGRFISQDNIDFIVPEHLTGLNLYAYCNNNPIMFTDDSGCLPNWAKWLIGGVAFVGAVALTVISGGSLAPVFVGMAASIAIGGTIDGAISAANGGSFWQGFANGAADGAMLGGIFALGGAGIRTFKMVKNGVALGENMTRVSALAKEGGQITYKGMPGYNIVRRIGGESIARKLSMAHNEAFIKRMMKLGVKLVDYGIDASRPYRSWYYLMETIVSNGYKNLILK